MKKLLLSFVASTALIALSACATAPIASSANATGLNREDGKLDGHWSGVLRGTQSDAQPLGIRLAVSGASVKVLHQNSVTGTWSEVMPGLFQMTRKRNNAVLHATDSGDDNDGTWVETWTLVVTVVSSTELKVEWVRLVNNIDLPVTNPGKTFSEKLGGTLSRVNGI